MSGSTIGGDWNPLDACNAPPPGWCPASSSYQSAATMPGTDFSRSSTWRSLNSLRSSRFPTSVRIHRFKSTRTAMTA